MDQVEQIQIDLDLELLEIELVVLDHLKVREQRQDLEALAEALVPEVQEEQESLV